jgi:hypothetical protein
MTQPYSFATASYIAIMPPNQKVTAADRLMYSYPLGRFPAARHVYGRAGLMPMFFFIFCPPPFFVFIGNVLSRVLSGMLSYVGGSIAYGCEIAEDEDVVDITRLQTCAQQAMPTIIAR